MEQPKPLRLEIDPADAPRLARLPAIRDRTPGRAVTRAADSVFYDTPDRQLAANNVVLEVRSDGRRRIQAVRADGALVEGARVTRSCEAVLAGDGPDVAAIGDADLRLLATPLPGLGLEPIARLDLKRARRRLTAAAGGTVELAVASGQVTVGGTVHPVARIELTPPADDPAEAYRLALALQAEIPLRVAGETVEALALRLAYGRGPAWRKAGPLDLPADATTEEALAHIVTHCLEHLVDNETCTRLSDHPEGVHQMRVSMRRMRSALRLFRPLLPADQYARVAEEVRWVTAGLAEARDLDVFTDEIAGPVAAAFAEEPAFAALKTCLAEAGSRAREAAQATVASPRFTRFLLESGQWIAGRAWRDQPVSADSSRLFQPITGLASELLSSRFKKVGKRGRRFAQLDAAERHQLRIDVKRLRYATDFFASLYGRKRVRSFTESLQKLQDGLGYMNDVAVARHLVERLEGTAGEVTAPAVRHAGAILIGWHSRAAAEAMQTLAADVEALITCKPFWSAEPDQSEAA